jgi:hypothetical protein
MSILLSVSFAIFAVFIAVIVGLFEIPYSISDSFYLLDERKRGLGYVFTGWCWAQAVAVMPLMLESSDGQWWQFFGLFAAGGLGFVGTAPLFKGHERTIHYVSAGTCAAAAMAWMCLAGYALVPVVTIAACAMIAARAGNTVFWFETGMFASVYAVLWSVVSEV